MSNMIKMLKNNIFNISYVSLSHVCMIISLIGIQVAMARVLGPKQYGILLLSQSLIAIIEATLISRAGEVAIYIIGRAWHNPEESKNLWGYVKCLIRSEFYWNFFSWVILVLGLYFFSEKFNADLICCLILSLAIPFQCSYGVSKGILIASGDIKVQTTLEILYSSLSLILVPVLTLLYGVIGGSIGFAIMPAMKTLLAHYQTIKILENKESNKKYIHVRISSLSLQSFLRSGLKNILIQSEILILGIFSSASSVSVYKIGRTLANISIRAADPIWSIARPKILHYISTENKKLLKNYLFKSALILFIFGYILIFPLSYLYGEKIVSILYGDIFRESFDVFLILFFGAWMYSGVTGWLNFTLVVSDNKKIGVYFLLTLNIFVAIGCYLSRGVLEYQSFSISAIYIFFSVAAWVIYFGKRIVNI